MEPLTQPEPEAHLVEAALAPPLPPSPTLRRRLRDWAGILSAYFTAQTVTQLVGLGAGLILVRFMPVGEFALYTLASSVVTFFIFLSDLGSTSSLLYFFHRTASDGSDFHPYLKAVLSLRRGAFLLGCLAVLLIFPRTALAKGFRLADVVLAACGILLAVWFQIASSVRVLALRLAGRYGRSYRAEIAGSGVRLAFAVLMVATALLRAWIGILSTAIGTAVIARLAAPDKEPPAPPGEDAGYYRRQVLRYILPSLPSALYFSIQGPLVVWLSATFGATRNIAEVGALGRLGLIVGLCSGLTGIVFLPRMVRIVDERLYRKRYLQFGGMLLAIALTMLAAARLVPGAFLLILGRQYAGLQHELLLVIAGAGLTLLSGYAVTVNLARSWNRWEFLAVLVVMATQILLVLILPLASTAGVLRFNVISASVGLACQLVIAAIGFSHPRRVQWMK